MSHIDNILIQVRSLLQQQGIKLWLEPYFYEEIGSIESEIEKLAKQFSQILGISFDNCKSALSELQDGAISKLQARKEFGTTGIATFKVKVVRLQGSSSVTTIKCPLSDTGKQLQEKLAQEIQVEFKNIKIICAGKVLQPESSLENQGITNNQQLMVLVGNNNSDDSAIYDRVRKAKKDAELILQAKHHNFFRMEDQDGNAVHLPPDEKKAITMALALYEKGRTVLKRGEFAEALVLFLESDEEFSKCNSGILNSVDNYALLNLDIVWCYLCLKSFSQLPDAERRLKICQENFQRSYGQNMDRVIALKGSSQNEKALIMRLHLLQGILYFHQNKRNEAYEKLSLAEEELRSLKVDDNQFMTLLQMGYGMTESRIALRSCNNNIEQAINFISERKKQKKEARLRNHEEEKLNRNLRKFNNGENDNSWVNPRTLNNLVEMGFDKEMAFMALKMTDNNIQDAVELLHNNPEQLTTEIHKHVNVDDNILDEIVRLGFDPEMARIALESVFNNPVQAVELLKKMQNEGNYASLLDTLNDSKNRDQNIETSTASLSNEPGPSTGNTTSTNIFSNVKNKIKQEIEALNAYNRFAEDMSNEDDEYLDLPLINEENILCEYKRLLEQ